MVTSDEVIATANEMLEGLPADTAARLAGQHVVYAQGNVLVVATPGLHVTRTLVNLAPLESGRIRIIGIIAVAEGRD